MIKISSISISKLNTYLGLKNREIGIPRCMVPTTSVRRTKNNIMPPLRLSAVLHSL